NDDITANDKGDSLVGAGGDDKLTAGAGIDILSGGDGNDVLIAGGNLTTADRMDGGAGTDTLLLDGDYSKGLVFGAATATNIETIGLADGNSYKLYLNNSTNTAGLTVDASKLTGAYSLTLSGAAETLSALTAIGGAGADILLGGRGNDILEGGAGADQLMGGLGS